MGRVVDGEAGAGIGVVAALRAELGWLAAGPEWVAARGLTVRRSEMPDGRPPFVSTLSGVGKVRAARAASALVDLGVSALLVVGTAGALDPSQGIGELYLASEAVQWDLAVKEGRMVGADPALSDGWAEAAPAARRAVFLTADRPALGRMERRRRLGRARRGRVVAPGAAAIADMETAAVAAVAEASGVPWAALRVVSDRPPAAFELLRPAARRRCSFQANYAAVAGIPAESLRRLDLRHLAL